MTENPQIASPIRTQAILNRYHLSAKKSLGQNFLTDLGVLDNIVEAAEITKDDNVIEIGPGIGGLTEQLAKAANKVLGFEIDANLLPVLDETLAPYDNVEIINQDILKANLPDIISQSFDSDKKLKVVANLPYYITTPIVMDLITGQTHFDAIVVMMQKEVAERINAKPSTKPYGSLSVIVQELNNVDISFIVPKTAFIPQPKVDSAIVKLTQRTDKPVEPFDQKAFISFVRGCFMHQRKTLWNNLQGVFGKTPEIKAEIKDVLAAVKIDAGVRPENLTVEQFVDLANAFHTLKNLI
ncbi:16S rRNA (adenine(1518)-N(6)/adenine(1519)-N(6))-dimethyltransferase RsmA [Lentilactobacillus kefiri]|uniref:Ribosomal RNA small subunit methyltransferase A n=2 Tax=Lentilactobacillus kefiri TaxID=33962 RepID=A0A8E1RIU4_LENKE|nr:16S rRNA (adenine(1518)-N(6)/adenine(1519)-N(6))-dimethyltransferase RsmA [Lentilactobacillus kefiri]KRL53573.1 ribosomal RNA small subunit methyltransferase A [Lentilactobacillus parakefiri DSM 10551]KRM50511.1 ribosomal RNA small subunit methyltransferase A [Lentilactobacillus kefiri DSM 20587 = JCM 5818]MCJ2161541.1 16S rRNA (adenine(1518)-N(6)/adenine(1519)-N(6))-dimethyltransferase RsmA [Lentilactobacillus kefiri]MCP9369002.1 16S rRNA (adenine(1518)-N(6)/adenine(1519)-N(6))-dimethyltran